MDPGSFSVVPLAVIQDKRLTFEQMRVLIALFSFRSNTKHTAWPSRQALSELCGVHPSNISAATSALERLGWLRKEGCGGRSKASQYTLCIPNLTDETVADSATECEETIAEQATVSGQKTVADSATECEETIAEQATVSGQKTVADSATETTKTVAERATHETKTVADSAIKTVADSATRIEHTIEQTITPPISPPRGEPRPALPSQGQAETDAEVEVEAKPERPAKPVQAAAAPQPIAADHKPVVANDSTAPVAEPGPQPDGAIADEAGQPRKQRAQRQARQSSGAITLQTWLEREKAAGRKPVPDDDPVFDYAAQAGIPYDMLALCWREFRHRYTAPGSHASAKRYRDWRAVFRNAVRGNWLRLWFATSDGHYVLTTAGRQAASAHRMRIEEQPAQPMAEAA